MDFRAQVTAALAGGPVLKWPLLRTRRAGFRLAYSSMVASGEIVEEGTGAWGNPIYVGLPGSTFPSRKTKPVRIRKADLALMSRAGYSEAEARAILEPLVSNLPAYIRALTKAEERAKRIANDRDAERWQSTAASTI